MAESTKSGNDAHFSNGQESKAGDGFNRTGECGNDFRRGSRSQQNQLPTPMQTLENASRGRMHPTYGSDDADLSGRKAEKPCTFRRPNQSQLFG
jgi:hypothetical protein